MPEATSASQLSLEPLSAQLVAIGVVYLATYGVVWVLANVVFSSMPGLSKMAWGFHFIFGALLAMWARPVVRKVVPGVLDDDLLGRVASMVVDIITCAALCAVQLTVLKANLVPILLVTSVGGFVTLIATVWLARRAFQKRRLNVWFGTACPQAHYQWGLRSCE